MVVDFPISCGADEDPCRAVLNAFAVNRTSRRPRIVRPRCTSLRRIAGGPCFAAAKSRVSQSLANNSQSQIREFSYLPLVEKNRTPQILLNHR